MRTKTLLLAAALCAAGIASSMAQSNVYSVNVVGYYNVVIPGKGATLGRNQLIANQLTVADNTLNAMFPDGTPGIADSCQLFKWTGSSYGTISTYELGAGWDNNVALELGEGYFFKNVSATPLTLTFVGEVPQGALTTALPVGRWIKSSKVPQAGLLTTALNFPVAAMGDNGSQILQWSGTSYVPITDIEGGEYSQPEPTVQVGEAFFVKNLGAGTINWTRNFTVAP